MNISEDQLSRWAKAPSETQETKCQNAVNRIAKAIENKFGADVNVFLQGSYKNRTNVKLESDVDIVALYHPNYYCDISFLDEMEKKKYWDNFRAAEYTVELFKGDILKVLENEFDASEIKRKDKCITIKENSFRVNADVVPAFLHRRLKTAELAQEEGIQFVTDSGVHVRSFPNQHYDNGVWKNKETQKMYKAVLRILKNVRNKLDESGVLNHGDMPSFFLECLVWNVIPHSHFQKSTYHDATRTVVAAIYNDMLDSQKAMKYSEVSDLLWLFRGGREPEQAKKFMQSAWDLIGYEN